jgi:indoleacetamide hydrolase
MNRSIGQARRGFLKASAALVAAGVAASRGLVSTARSATASLTELSATEATSAMRRGEIGAEAYVTALLDRAAALKSLNAFVSLDRDKALEAARAADQSRAAGKALGILHGLPIPVKDSINTKDLPTTSGTKALRDFTPKDNALVLKPLFSAGAILLGKANLHELSFGWTSNNAVTGAVHNPYDQSRIPGGSSGGSGAAVAARIAPLAVGTDTYGSVRVPATMCGICGFRPSFARYPTAGVMGITPDFLDTPGPLARSVADLALFDSVITNNYTALQTRPLQGVRIGIAGEYFLRELDPEVERITSETLKKLQAAGAILHSECRCDKHHVEVPGELRHGCKLRATPEGYELGCPLGIRQLHATCRAKLSIERADRGRESTDQGNQGSDAGLFPQP